MKRVEPTPVEIDTFTDRVMETLASAIETARQAR